MALSVQEVDTFIKKQVQSGASSSDIEAENELVSVLVERGIDRSIEQSREAMKNGQYREMTEESNSQFLEKLSQKILSHN
jgi:hypothetical protein